jgi:PIN domain nuclease of toxin-antitoxin system
MRLLLDTHCLLWARAAPSRLSKGARAAVLDPRNELFVSAVSVWEIVIKHALGRLNLSRSVDVLVPEMIAATQAEELRVTHGHALQVARLPLHHADPFDRMLIAQAQVEHLSILTADKRFAVYDVEVVKA